MDRRFGHRFTETWQPRTCTVCLQRLMLIAQAVFFLEHGQADRQTHSHTRILTYFRHDIAAICVFKMPLSPNHASIFALHNISPNVVLYFPVLRFRRLSVDGAVDELQNLSTVFTSSTNHGSATCAVANQRWRAPAELQILLRCMARPANRTLIS